MLTLDIIREIRMVCSDLISKRESDKVVAEGPYGIEQVLDDWLFFNDDRGLKIFKFCCGGESYGKERENPNP